MGHHWPQILGFVAAAAICCYTGAIGLHLFMVVRTNRGRAKHEKLPYHLYSGSLKLLAEEYERLHPGSSANAWKSRLVIVACILAFGALVIRAFELRAHH
jgi:multisubunit Na+/H+ antiporter MnhG subunit